MKKYYLLLALGFLAATATYSQNSSIKGSVTDTLNKTKLANAVIAVLKPKDSTLVKFTRTDKAGNFELDGLPTGNYNVLITYPSFADYSYPVTTTYGKQEDIGDIKMTSKAKLLEDVVVRQKIAAVRLKGDTIEYKADSFKVRDGASVEEMLRKLPGLTVDKDGKITAQGEKIEKVLVDGEEFFGDDPTVATKNIQANAVDKVQVFDKKSDQAAFTGIDDGTKTKTLNLTLKDDKKKGYFGKLELAGDSKERWNNNGMFNSFRAKRKLSLYGIMSSTGKTGLNWDENSKFGENNNMEYNEDGGFFFSYNNGDEFDNNGAFAGEGLPKSWAAGLQYSKKYDNDKQNVNSSYRFNKLNTFGAGNTISQSILPGNYFINRETREFQSSKLRHSANAIYDYQLDSLTSLKIKANGFTGKANTLSTYNNEQMDQFGNGVQSVRSITSSGDNRSNNSNILLRRKFKKPGRTISLNVEQQFKYTNTTGFLFNINRFLDSGNLKRIDTIDQKKLNEITNEGYYSRVAYTEPVLQNVFVEFSYGVRFSNSESKKLTYDITGDGKYDSLNNPYSNSYRFNVLTNSAGMVWRYNGKKTTASIGGDVAHADFKQKDLLHDKDFNYSFNNFFPRASFMYKFNANTRINLNYNGSTKQPTVEQIQPVLDNSNPLNVAVGNPDLKQEFRHSVNINYNNYKVLKNRGFYVYMGFNTTTNSISTNETTVIKGSNAGVRTYQYVNLNGNYNGWSGAGLYMKVKQLDMHVNAGIHVNANRLNNIVSTLSDNDLKSVKNTTDNNSYGADIGFFKNKEKKYDLNYRVEVAYNTSTSTVNAAAKNNYYTHNHNFSATVQLPLRFEINSSVEAQFRQKTELFTSNNNVILWNGYLGKKFLKNDKALLSIRVNDILDQNKGFNRYVNSNIVSENTYQTLRRYFLLSFTFNFSKNPAGATTP